MPGFNVEYAKSGRASCKACSKSIAQGSLRIGTLSRSPFHDGEICTWVHAGCFKKRIPAVREVNNQEALRAEDQQRVYAMCLDGSDYIDIPTVDSNNLSSAVVNGSAVGSTLALFPHSRMVALGFQQTVTPVLVHTLLKNESYCHACHKDFSKCDAVLRFTPTKSKKKVVNCLDCFFKTNWVLYPEVCYVKETSPLSKQQLEKTWFRHFVMKCKETLESKGVDVTSLNSMLQVKYSHTDLVEYVHKANLKSQKDKNGQEDVIKYVQLLAFGSNCSMVDVIAYGQDLPELVTFALPDFEPDFDDAMFDTLEHLGASCNSIFSKNAVYLGTEYEPGNKRKNSKASKQVLIKKEVYDDLPKEYIADDSIRTYLNVHYTFTPTDLKASKRLYLELMLQHEAVQLRTIFDEQFYPVRPDAASKSDSDVLKKLTEVKSDLAVFLPIFCTVMKTLDYKFSFEDIFNMYCRVPVQESMQELCNLLKTLSDEIIKDEPVAAADTASNSSTAAAFTPTYALRDAIREMSENTSAFNAFSKLHGKQPPAVLKEILRLNNLEHLSRKSDYKDHALRIMYRGVPNACLLCKSDDVRLLDGMYKCRSYIDAFTRCWYETDNMQAVTACVLPEDEDCQKGFVSPLAPYPSKALKFKAEHEALTAASVGVVNRKSPYTHYNHYNQYNMIMDGDVLLKGRCTVEECSQTHHIYDPYADEKLTNKTAPYTVTMINTDVMTNKNSFYKMQILEADAKKKYILFRKWGRVGDSSQTNQAIDESTGVKSLIEQFKAHFQEKSGNEWGDETYQPYPKCLFPLPTVVHTPAKESKKFQETTQDSTQYKVMHAIGDMDNLKNSLKSMNLDVTQLLAGGLTAARVNESFQCLAEIEKLLLGLEARGETRGMQFGTNEEQCRFYGLNNKYFTLVPHVMKGRNFIYNTPFDNPELISNMARIKEENNLLSNLMLMADSINILEDVDEEVDNNVSAMPPHPHDVLYHSLNVKLETIDPEEEEFAMLEKYLVTTHADTHKKRSLKCALRVNRESERARFQACENKFKQDLRSIGTPEEDLDAKLNKQQLFHGSRTTNYTGILKSGLLIAPPSAPVSGYMFGKGIYFASCSSKSANYMFTNSNNESGYMLVCEVILGNPAIRLNADYIDSLPEGVHSTHGVGRYTTNPEEHEHVAEHLKLPVGKIKELRTLKDFQKLLIQAAKTELSCHLRTIETMEKSYKKVPKAEQDKFSKNKNKFNEQFKRLEAAMGTAHSLLYDEFIVYDVAQVRIKYMLEVD